MNQSRILPFYMAYPLPMYYQEEDTVTRDLEYLQQMYPVEAKRYLKIIVDTLNQIDYEGSMIYDEYPDRYGMERLTESVWNVIKREEQSQNPQEMQNAETGEWIKALLFVLLNTEVYKRRHGNTRRFLKF